MSFKFGVARSQYDAAAHPRVFIAADELEQLRQRCRRGFGKRVLKALHDQTSPLADRVLACDDVLNLVANWNVNWTQPGTPIVGRASDTAMAAVLTDDARMIDAMKRVLLIAPEAEKAGRQGVRRLGHSAGGGLALAYDLLHHTFTEAQRTKITRYLHRQCVKQVLADLDPVHLKSAGSNLAIGGLCSGIYAALACRNDPGVPSLDDELARLLQLFEATLYCTTGPDGYPEEDIAYGTAVAGITGATAEALRRAGLYDINKQCPRFNNFGRAVLHFVQPWGQYLSNTGDHSDEFSYREMTLARLASETNDPTLIWLLGQISWDHKRKATAEHMSQREVPFKAQLTAPPTANTLLVLADIERGFKHPRQIKPAIPTAYRERSRGLVSFRSSWNDDATLLVFDGSQRNPAAQGHHHASSGHFSLTALGEYFAIDTGRYCNEQDQHNIVLVDGKSGRSTDGEWVQMNHPGRLIDYRPDAFCDFASADSSHQHNCYWAVRHVGLVKGKPSHAAPAWAFTIEDVNKANDWSEYWWALNTSPENKIKLQKQSATITGCRHGNHLDIHFALPGKADYPKPHTIEMAQDEQTPSSHKYVPAPRDRAADFTHPRDMVHGPAFLRPRVLAKVQGYCGRFMSILLPRAKGAARAKFQQLPSPVASLAIKVSFEHVTDTLVWAYEHHLLEADGIVGRGQWVIVRRSNDTGKVLAHTAADCDALSVDGRTIRV